MDFEETLASAEKTRVRLEMRQMRDALDTETRAVKNAAIMAAIQGLDEFRQADAVMTYVAFGSEVDPDLITRAAVEAGKRTMIPDAFGVLEIVAGIPTRVEAAEIDLVLVPGIAFDTTGRRLGYGGGWYDRFTTQLRPGVKLVGLAFEEQIVEGLPEEPHDMRLDMIVSDRRIVRSR